MPSSMMIVQQQLRAFYILEKYALVDVILGRGVCCLSRMFVRLCGNA